MSLLDSIDAKLPRWMLTAPRTHVGKLAAGLAAMLDALALQVIEGRLAGLPGQVRLDGVEGLGGFDSCDALPLIGRDRSIRQGLSESVWAYAARLRAWLDEWAVAGTPFGLLEQLAGVLGPDPGILRIVTARGEWWSRSADGSTFTYQNQAGTGFDWQPVAGTLVANANPSHAWDWDSVTWPAPTDQLDPGRFWVIAYAPLNAPWCAGGEGTFQDKGLVGDFWDDPTTWAVGNPSPDAGTVGLAAPRKWVDIVRHVIADHKPAGIVCKRIIVSLDPAAFDPTLGNDSTPTSVPDGTWGHHGKLSGGVWVPARFPNARYIHPTKGSKG